AVSPLDTIDDQPEPPSSDFLSTALLHLKEPRHLARPLKKILRPVKLLLKGIRPPHNNEVRRCSLGNLQGSRNVQKDVDSLKIPQSARSSSDGISLEHWKWIMMRTGGPWRVGDTPNAAVGVHVRLDRKLRVRLEMIN
ncbi:hypothetical protein PSHT_12644, partial [Puccinia striiformis]